MNLTDYLADPCRASSIPYWKTRTVAIPDDMLILHQDEWLLTDTQAYTDARYFRLFHDLTNLHKPTLPPGFSFCTADLADYARHISECYGMYMEASELSRYLSRPVYCAELWLAIRDDASGQIAASGIGELDREIGEGALEWIQVSKEYRRHGLGACIVLALLCRMRGQADFVTVSGQCGHPDNPEALYRSCGFTGTDVWHIMRKKDLPDTRHE